MYLQRNLNLNLQNSEQKLKKNWIINDQILYNYDQHQDMLFQTVKSVGKV